jgi:hypothetical protein
VGLEDVEEKNLAPNWNLMPAIKPVARRYAY